MNMNKFNKIESIIFWIFIVILSLQIMYVAINFSFELLILFILGELFVACFMFSISKYL